MAYMVQFNARGGVVRRARFSALLWQLWQRQLPACRVQLVVEGEDGR